MTRRAVLFGAVILVSLWTGDVRLHACVCGAGRVPCEATWEAAAVFVGQLLSTVDEEPGLRRDPPAWAGDLSRRFNFRVIEAFRGVSTPQVAIYADRTSSCALTLTQAQTYLVYASRFDDGRLYTHMCSRTRIASDAAEDLEYLRGPAMLSTGLGSIQGVARQPDLAPKDAYDFDAQPPFAGGRVRVESTDPSRPAIYEGITGPDGRYAVKVPVGKYRVAMSVRDGLWTAGPYRNMPLEVRDPRGCASADFSVYPDGRLGGRLLDAGGRPMPAMNVELRPVGDRAQSSFRRLYSARTDDSGVFDFRQLFPGDYVVGLTLDTSERSIWLERDGEPVRSSFEIAAEQRRWIGEVLLPKSLELTTVKGFVLDASGKAAQDAQVRVLEERGSHEPGSTPAGTDGSFTFSLAAGRTYVLIAERNFEPGTRREQAKSAPFKAAPGAMSFTLRFEK